MKLWKLYEAISKYRRNSEVPSYDVRYILVKSYSTGISLSKKLGLADKTTKE